MVNTFLPIASFKHSAECLDYKRLNKQILECDQILAAIEKDKSGFTGKIGWINHPATRMWRGYENALKIYRNTCLKAWIGRGYNSTREFLKVEQSELLPIWFGRPDFHASHRSNLLRKDREYYSQFFWTEPDNLPYVWPV
jgi:Pyrimidine dimer DNA glycosylase